MVHAKRPTSQALDTSFVTTDEDLVSIARRRLSACGYAQLSCITCRFDHGVCVLRGTVSTFYLKQIAQEQIRSLQGVKQIVNELRVCAGEEPQTRDRNCCDVADE